MQSSPRQHFLFLFLLLCAKMTVPCPQNWLFPSPSEMTAQCTQNWQRLALRVGCALFSELTVRWPLNCLRPAHKIDSALPSESTLPFSQNRLHSVLRIHCALLSLLTDPCCTEQTDFPSVLIVAIYANPEGNERAYFHKESSSRYFRFTRRNVT